jgi:hypothetical protein
MSLYSGEKCLWIFIEIRSKKGDIMTEPLHTRVRRTAFNLWEGPNSLYTRDENDLIGGNCVLRLAIRKEISIKPIIEARAVYAILEDGADDVVIRAVYWDSHTFIRNLPLVETVTKLPVKFVRIPHEQLQHWVEAFAGLHTSIQISVREEASLPICSLRVETSAVECSFEKVWQVVPDDDRELNRVWQEVWQEMGLALQTAPTLTDMEESFPHAQIEPGSYDFQSYQPSLNLQ